MRIQSAVLLAWRTFQTRPRRTAVLLLGFGVGVAVMIALLAVGDALLLQAQDREVVSGGDLVLLPAGIDPEVIKVGAVTAMFLAIPNARFLVRQVLLGPRFGDAIEAASPEITDKLVYVRVRKGGGAVIVPARAAAAIPSAAQDSQSALAIDDPAWTDTAADRDWLSPSAAEALEAIDRFHRPVAGPQGRTWAEWWYFNFIDRSGLTGYISFIADREGRALVSVTTHMPGRDPVRWQETQPGAALPFQSATFQAGPHRADLRNGVYDVRLWRADFSAELRFRPVPHLYFPPVEWQAGAFRSGYVVPALRASVEGMVKVGGETVRIDGHGYHDHNWGVWQAVTWEWGTASVPEFALLSGLVRHPSMQAQQMLVALYARDADRTGLLGALRAGPPVFSEWRTGPSIGRAGVRVPGRLRYVAVNDAGDRLNVDITVRDVIATRADTQVFLQMRGGYKVEGRVGGRTIVFSTEGFAETFVPVPSQ